MTGEPIDQVPFEAHVELIRRFLAHRDAAVGTIQGLLNAQQEPAHYLQDRALLSRHFEDCFFTLAALSRDQVRLRGRLQQAHWARGFRPRDMAQMPNELFDPAGLVVRAFGIWRQTRWPGHNGRLRFAQTLFSLYLTRCLTLLAMRLWDDAAADAAARLALIQDLLDQLWRDAPADQPVLVRDARWLIPLAQSPVTDELAPYFVVAQQVAESLPERDRIEIHKASVLMAGGHLRSQLRHYNMQGASLTDREVVLGSRRSNALDFAMTIQNLVPLLGAYERAARGGERQARLALADAICQGVSADPELFVNRIALLGAYSMIEYLFAAADPGGTVAYTRAGERHVRLLREYAALMQRLAKLLHEDCLQLRPVDGAYSPYGVMYGFSYNLIEHMAMKSLQPEVADRFSLEDVFTAGQADKLAWIGGLRKLPHVSQEVLRMYEYPRQFAHDMFDRVERALRRCAADGESGTGVATGRLFVFSVDDARVAPQSAVVELPPEYVLSSDAALVAANRGRFCEEKRLLHDRKEGEFLVSYQTPGGWVAITKDVLTEVLGAGRDAGISGLPAVAAAVLKSMCPDLVQYPGGS